ncbi:FAD-dependent oxidoreductase [Reticulibacter mediterranei]|uniref:FAD-dependent oxidoreductase n=1 Tax=Reticulibacter mediterranei TaxID=2778369 RepID=A0A8J3IQC5_9CHLR|nr:FAD-dependent monooxygenase [Reticulibacter mediterranei]GHO98268.1 FAD-dependent oxidoreductase [Reticulibacter mediterranei]
METSETETLSLFNVPVLIVGGGLAGLSMSLFLSWYGIRSMVVEKHPEPARLPRARGHNARTMELFRAVGLEEIIREAQSPTAANSGMVRVESLMGHELAHLSEGLSADLSTITPIEGCVIGQDQLEPILVDQIKELGGTVRFNTELLSFEQDEEMVTSLIRQRTTGQTFRIRSLYLIAADGNHSSIREALGIQTQGPGTISYTTDVAFEADLSAALRRRRVYLYFISNSALPDGQAGLMPLDNERKWSFGFPVHPERGERREDMTDERCIELIRIAVGIPDLAVKILPAYPWDSVKVGVWEQAARYAERYRSKRVFLAGDSAHAVLPAGGLGAGTAIQDAFNLAWKLNLVLHGNAGPALLDTYEDERKPIGTLTVQQTLQRHFYRTGTAESTLIDSDSLIFGYRYRSAAIMLEPGADEAPLTQHPTTQHGEPGTHAPHVMLERDGWPIPTIDLYRGFWTLLIGEDGAAWREAAQRLSFRLLVDSLGENGLEDVSGLWYESFGVGTEGAVLIRPDGFVAWRETGNVDNPYATLERVLDRVLCRRNMDAPR